MLLSHENIFNAEMIFEINPKQTMDHVWITNCTMRREWAQEEKPYEQCLELKWWNLLLFCVSHHYSLLLYALQYICIENKTLLPYCSAVDLLVSFEMTIDKELSTPDYQC